MLVIDSVHGPASAAPGDTVDIVVTVTNRGGATSIDSAFDFHLGRHGSPFGAAAVVDGTQIDGFLITGTIKPGQSVTETQSLPLPSNLGAGDDDLWVHLTKGDGDPKAATSFGKFEIAIQGPQCPSNGYEPNDSPATATPLPLGTPLTLDLCSDPVDWLRISTQPGSTYGVVVAPSRKDSYGTPGEDPLTLFDADGTTRITPSPQVDDRRILLFTAPGDKAYVEVGSALLGGIQLEGPGSTYTVDATAARPDWALTNGVESDEMNGYVGQATAGSLPRVEADLHDYGYPATGPVDVGVYVGAAGTKPGPSDRLLRKITVPALDTNGLSPLSIDTPMPSDLAPGDYALAVIVDPDDLVPEIYEGDNEVTMPVTVAAAPCAPDAYEDDDVQYMAQPISAPTTQSHNFCDDMEDWLGLDVTSGSTYTVTVTSSYGDIAIDLYDDAGTTLAQSDRSGYTPVQVSWTATLTGTIYIYVEELFTFGTGTDYTVQVQ